MAITPERWERVAEIYEAALSREPSERSPFVLQSTHGDEELRNVSDLRLHGRPQAAAAVVADLATLAPETVIGSHRVISLLGQGGMGQVYRAHDTKLQRDVALKILPDTFVDDPDRLARFRREDRRSARYPLDAATHAWNLIRRHRLVAQ